MDAPHARLTGESRQEENPEGDQPTVRPEDPKAGDSIGEFGLIRELGRGGMGQVWEASQPSLDRHVALKLVLPGVAIPGAVARFAQEARAGGRLSHPHIVRVYSYGKDHSLDWIAMELIEGGRTLHDLIEEQRSTELPDAGYPQQIAELVASLADALGAAHAAGVIHRDVKPRNVLLTEEDSPKLTDFGLARLEGEAGLTQTGSAAGTCAYMSPEQIKAERSRIDHRTDIFSLGVVLYELLALQRPFEGDSFQQVMTKILLVEPVPLRQLRSRVPVELETITAKAMAKDRHHRYPSMEELAADLRRFIAHEPIHARPPGRLRKARMWMRRHPVLTASGLVGTLASVAIVGLALVATRNARLAESRAAELEQVVEFQAQQFADVDVEGMGLSLRGGLREKLGELNVRRGRDAAEQEESLAAYDEQVAGADFTNLALQTLDSHVFTPALGAVERQFGDQPLVRARLLQTLAETMRLAGLLEHAMEPQVEALEIRRRELGDEDERTLVSSQGLGTLLLAQSKLSQAEPILRETLATYRRTLGDEHPETLKALEKLGALVMRRGEFEQAALHYTEVLEGRRRLFGDGDASTLTALNNLGALRMLQSRFDEALAYFREALEGRRRVLGDENPYTLQSIQSMADLLIELDQLSQAALYASEGLATRRRLLGGEHPETLDSINTMGRLLIEQGKPTEAERFIREALEIRRRALGDEHLDTYLSLNAMGKVLAHQGKFEQALPYFLEALATARRTLGEHSNEAVMSLSNVAATYHYLGRTAKVLAYFREVLEVQRQNLGDDNTATLATIQNVAGQCQLQGLMDEAESLFREALEGRRRVLGAEHDDTQASLLALGGLQVHRGMLDEAAVNFRELLDICRRVHGEETQQTADALGSLGSVLHMQGKPDEAEPFLRTALAVRRSVSGQAHFKTLEVLAILAELLIDRGSFDEAASLSMELEEHTRAAHPDGHPELTAAMELLVRVHEAWHAAEPGAGHDADAAPWRARLGR